MNRYKMPEVLGCGEFEPCADEPDYPKVGFDLPGVSGILWLDRVDLTEVVPPLPEEPTDLGFYFLNPDKGDGFLVERQLDGWWNLAGRMFTSSWEQLHEDYPGLTLTRLVPEQVVGAVTLPWTGHPEKEGANAGACWADMSVKASSRYSGRGLVTVTTGATFAYVSPDTADAMAAALTTAAAKARQS